MINQEYFDFSTIRYTGRPPKAGHHPDNHIRYSHGLSNLGNIGFVDASFKLVMVLYCDRATKIS